MALYDKDGMLILRSSELKKPPKKRNLNNKSTWSVLDGKKRICKSCRRDIKQRPELWCMETKHKENYTHILKYMREYHRIGRTQQRKFKYDTMEQ
jgi:hypothetical protein